MPQVLLLLLVASQGADPASPPLKSRLEAFFQMEKAQDRNSIAKEISANYSAAAVAAELPHLSLWKEWENSGEWQVRLPSGATVRAVYRLPESYDPSRPVPLVVVFPANPQEPGNAITQILVSAPVPAPGMVALGHYPGGHFHQRLNDGGDLPGLIREIRKRVHVDVDRVLLIGFEEGASSAWVAGMMHAMSFAGIVSVNGTPLFPYPEYLLAVLLPNLRVTSLLAVWADNPEKATSLPALNRAIGDFAQTGRLPIEFVAVSGRLDGEMPWPAREVAEFLSGKRTRQSKVEHWFRYLPQGNLGWIRATEAGGEVWDHEQISIAVHAKEDRDEFVLQTLKDKLFYISGAIEGQTIRIESRRLEGIELRLSPDLLDLSQPVIVEINGRKRFEGVLKPSVHDLLECAYETWDFQHPAYVRKHFAMLSKSERAIRR